jgi:abhydrolase domain-containing protein 12
MRALAKAIFIVVFLAIALYGVFLAALTTAWVQSHVVYLNAIKLPFGADLSNPMPYGFLPGQVSTFVIPVLEPGAEVELFAWHILPLHLMTISSQRSPLEQLADSDTARLVIVFHGAAGTVASGYRPDNYRAAAALSTPEAPIHVITFDYRGFGSSGGRPSEEGLVRDGLAVVEWAIKVARVPPQRIVLLGHSIGTAVAVAVAERLANRQRSVRDGTLLAHDILGATYQNESELAVPGESDRNFAGLLLIRSFVDVSTLVSTYAICGVIPILGPMSRFTTIMNQLRRLILDKWSTGERIGRYVGSAEKLGWTYGITLLHAKDDWDLPWTHTRDLFELVVKATGRWKRYWNEKIEEIPSDEQRHLQSILTAEQMDLGQGGEVTQWCSEHGSVRKEILNYGLHNVVKSWPVVSVAVARFFQEGKGCQAADDAGTKS